MHRTKEQSIFALDIGTRSVVGLILHKKDDHYHVVDVERLEHNERSMLDGQIHNIVAVSSVINQVKSKLEKSHGPLKKVCVAAAGRSLKTKRAKAEMNISGNPIFDKESVLHLELSAVQKAQFKLAQTYSESDKQVTDYCVGYSVIDYRLDGEQIGSLIDHQGEAASAEVIATFLPKVVVESLISALKRAELELEALTLEPIAAINVLIPPSMRRLNVALVDIGAGTSDIAITELGTVTAYGMVPVAGDEITEAISDHYLLDFPDAEIFKRDLMTKDTVTITDILGFESKYEKTDVVATIQSAVDRLAEKISHEIISLNNKPPKAVMLVGGGSLTPSLTTLLAEKLSLPENRVAVRGIDAIKGLQFEKEWEETPELVTPIGIAIAAKESPVEYVSVKVNEQDIRLFDIKQLTIGDALISSGLELTKLYGKPGMAMMVKLNGKVVSIPGDHGTPPIIKRNGQPAKLDELLSHNDEITVEKGQDGKNAIATVKYLIEHTDHITVTVNDEQVKIEPIVRINGEVSFMESEVKDRDQIEYRIPQTLSELLYSLQQDEHEFQTTSWKLFIDREEVHVTKPGAELLINGHIATLDSKIKDGDHVSYEQSGSESLQLQDVFAQFDWQMYKEIAVTFNEKAVTLKKAKFNVYRNGEKLSDHSTVFNSDELHVVEKEDVSFIYQDIFAKVDVERPKERNKKPVILRNNHETTFSSPIIQGDTLTLKWVDL
ncbi:pilus assembly protein PilM [Bacillus shivajii]|uniref:pilus assembly protein PilM n=1 Tax=Bacillus shivajii TaxID=1983719 RepID=UPI001CF99B5E|nr:pilus assembly protein PilM [Bacillus shivajii]UCZ52312.1 pilus assembly protein PilM [Bacillus shivajii]